MQVVTVLLVLHIMEQVVEVEQVQSVEQGLEHKVGMAEMVSCQR